MCGCNNKCTNCTCGGNKEKDSKDKEQSTSSDNLNKRLSMDLMK